MKPAISNRGGLSGRLAAVAIAALLPLSLLSTGTPTDSQNTARASVAAPTTEATHGAPGGCGCGLCMQAASGTLPTLDVATAFANRLEDAAPSKAADHVIKSAHYELLWQGDKATAEDSSRALEAAWPQYKALFDGEPKLKKGELLKVFMFAAPDAWKEKLKKDGSSVPEGAGGYYWPPTKTAYLYSQPSAWFTRTLMLHEAFHQFHYLARANNTHIPHAWYVEGLAEHVSRHAWDGKAILTSRTPLLSLESYHAKALATAKQKDFSLAKLIAGEVAAQRPESMAVVAWLMTSSPDLRKKFDEMRVAVDRGGNPKNEFKRTIGDPDKLQSEFVAWVEKNQEPLIPVYVEWDNIGAAAVKGWANEGVWTLSRQREKRDWISASLPVPEAGEWRAGLMLNHAANDDYVVATINRDNRAEIQHYNKGKWENLSVSGSVPPLAESLIRTMKAERRDGKTIWTVDGRELAKLDMTDGYLGLCAYGCTATFSELVWPGFPPAAAKDPKAKPSKGKDPKAKDPKPKDNKPAS